MPYQPYQIQGQSGLLDGLSQQDQNKIGMTGTELASSFGIKNADKYANYFNPIDISQSQEGLASLGGLRDYQYGQARQGYGQQMNQLNTRVGQTGFSNTGSFGGLLGQLQSGLDSQLLGIDKGIQSLYSGYQDQVAGQVADQYSAAQNVMGSGAKINPSERPVFSIDKYGTDMARYIKDVEAWNQSYGGQ